LPLEKAEQKKGEADKYPREYRQLR